MPDQIVEIKQHLNKPNERYVCTLLAREPGRVWLGYAVGRDWEFAGVRIPSGSTTVGEYVSGRPYVAWVFVGADGEPLGCLVHACEGLTIAADRVEYTDLILDVWAEPGAAPRVLDEDELAEAVLNGTATEEQAERARRAVAEVIESWEEICERLTAQGLSPARGAA